MLPDGWIRCKFGDIASFKNGLNFTKSDEGESIKIVGVSDFQKRTELANTTDLATIRVATKVRDTELLSSGDLLFVRSNGNKALIGRCLFFPTVTERLAFSGFTIRGRVDRNVIAPNFASYLVRSKLVTDQIFRGGSGTNISNLSQEILASVTIGVPPIPEQERIAHVLATWDQAIAIVERLLAISHKQNQALMQQLLTGQKRLIRFQSVTEKRHTPLGSIPADWQYPRIEAFAKEVATKRGSGSAFPVLSCTKHAGLVDSLSYFNKQVFSADTSTYKVVPRDCFVYATNHIEEGSIGYQNLYDFGLVSPMYTVFKTTDKVLGGYLYRLLKTEHYRQIFAAATNASVDRRGSLRWKEFKKLRIPLPSLEEQRAISELLDTVDREIELVDEQLASLRAEKAALMKILLTGKRRVHLYAEAAGAPA